jgi:Fe-S-cluster containining protein
MSEEMVPVTLDQPFRFHCSPARECFNRCCTNFSQCLTPYDILRLKRRLGMHSSLFLRTHTSRHTGLESGLPMVEFKPDPASGYACPFLCEQGCSVYMDRPSSCRLYPLARAVARSRETGLLTEYYAVVEEPHCLGFDASPGSTAGQWLAGQGLAPYNAMNDRMMDLVSLKNRLMPGRLDGWQADLFHLACYDLDTFREKIFTQGILEGFPVPGPLLERVRTDDESLLTLGMDWLAFRLFGRGKTFGEES